MKGLLLLLLVIIIVYVWAILFPNAKITIKAENIKDFINFMYHKLEIWYNNRLQTHRLRQSLVQREIMLFTIG